MKTILVTGASSGIGKVSARVLAEQGHRLLFTARTEAKALATLNYLNEHAANADVSYFLCDFASQAQVHALAEAVKAKYTHLDVLLNNAGSVFTSHQKTEDGIERTFAVNHLGYFLVTHLLLDRLKASSSARIVNVSSNAHESVKNIDFNNLGFEQNYNLMKAYSQSKLANLMFSYELARRLEATSVTVNALHPGFVATNIGADSIPIFGKAIKRLINVFAKDVEIGAKTSIYLASSPDIEGITGKYFVDCKEQRSSVFSYDELVQKQLWEVSEALVNLS